jgi:Putative peptidoglycan binding domain/CHAP domain
MSDILRSGASGTAVGELQQALIEAGWVISGMECAATLWGPTTDAAVRGFQRAAGLTVDGVVGPKTRAVLLGAADGSYVSAGWRFDAGIASVAEVLRQAVGAIGVAETPPGSNRGAMIDAWNTAAGLPLGSPWCAAFATGMFRFAAGGNPFGKPLGSALKVREWGRARARVVAAAGARPGDVLVLMRDGVHGHVALVSARVDRDRVATVEGNAGNAVRGMLRDLAAADAVVRPVLV